MNRNFCKSTTVKKALEWHFKKCCKSRDCWSNVPNTFFDVCFKRIGNICVRIVIKKCYKSVECSVAYFFEEWIIALRFLRREAICKNEIIIFFTHFIVQHENVLHSVRTICHDRNDDISCSLLKAKKKRRSHSTLLSGKEFDSRVCYCEFLNNCRSAVS